MWPAYGYLSPFSKVFLKKASLFCGHGWHAINTKCCLGSMPSEANCKCHPAHSHVHMRVGRCPHGMANCHRRVRPNPTDKVWELVLYKPRSKKKKAAYTPTTPQQIYDKTSLLLTPPLTQQTVLRILQIMDSPDY